MRAWKVLCWWKVATGDIEKVSAYNMINSCLMRPARRKQRCRLRHRISSIVMLRTQRAISCRHDCRCETAHSRPGVGMSMRTRAVRHSAAVASRQARSTPHSWICYHITYLFRETVTARKPRNRIGDNVASVLPRRYTARRRQPAPNTGCAAAIEAARAMTVAGLAAFSMTLRLACGLTR